MRPVESGSQQIDLRFQDVDPFKQARGSAFQMLLQHETVDELDLTPLHDLETARRAQILFEEKIPDLSQLRGSSVIFAAPSANCLGGTPWLQSLLRASEFAGL
jgi:hypothetical protein